MEAVISATPEVSIIVPARNEEVCLGDCLHSLVSQTGVTFEIIVVDDQSTDRTRAIAESFTSVRVLSPGPLPEGWTGKNNAVTAGARVARGEWLLFTDADTVHLPGSLAAARAEAKEQRAELLSYSPEQIAVTFWEIATLPVVFAALARQYPPALVSDPKSPLVAANGQYILVRRGAYDAVGGHAAVATDLLEDVALARAVKGSGRKIHFRYAGTSVRTRMYRNFHQLREGWTKNLALLFPNAGWLAAKVLLGWSIAWLVFCLPWIARLGAGLTTGAVHAAFHWWLEIGWLNGVALVGPFSLMYQLRKANFTWDMEILGALFGYPMFAYLLLRSKKAHERGKVSWKGRRYAGSASQLAATDRDAGGILNQAMLKSHE